MKLANVFWLPRFSLSVVVIMMSIAFVSLFSHVQSCFPYTCACESPPIRASPPISFSYKTGPGILGKSITDTRMADMENKFVVDVEKLRAEFLQVLRSRRSVEAPLRVESAKPVTDPLYQDATPPTFSEAMESCPKANISNLKDLLQEENLYLITEAGEQGRLPLLIISLKEKSNQTRPAVVFLHSTHKNKEWLRPLLEAFASRGYISIAIDSRYHGERARNKTTYRDALISSWKNGDTMPFLFDTAWDLIKLADYLTTERKDIDHSRIGITGESLGGMHAWFAAAADTRYAVVAPIIGVQGFRWAIENDKWQGRVDSIKPVFERAEDPRCPLDGLKEPHSRTCKAYEAAKSLDNFKLNAQPGIGHQMTSEMVKEASDWFDKFLK
ncbi:uncharacterized protein LOC125423016 isoform X2 [Ziziphus jujuba]|uniref:Uncharacterized protein LOC125423016 isoform X2 n=1 Tax=Ziziphus jujuba TaxID=326968 RepID=A0ABM3IN13_ZIZJJ|nr:uncharacterized protein LOC125423016 isoform X2 [Ziziphus jujuba]